MCTGVENNCLNLNEANHLSVGYGWAGALQSAQGVHSVYKAKVRSF